jgi:hypothetical protein
MLARATRRLGLPVTVVHAALSAEAGVARLFIPTENGRRKTGFATLEPRRERGTTHEVPLRRLDDVCAGEPGRISFVKIDVEGHELGMLRGRDAPPAPPEPADRDRAAALVGADRADVRVAGAGRVPEGVPRGGRAPQPLEAFDVERHQTGRLDRVGTPGYVSNFIFYPR